MNVRTAIRRITAMDARELRFRLAGEARKRADGVRHRLHPRDWRRSALARVLDPSRAPLVAAAVEAARRGSFGEAHEALGRHFVGRTSVWPVAASRRGEIRSAIATRFADARDAATLEAQRLLDGRCDVLGYRDLDIGTPPDWHADPVHRRRAPIRFWADIDYLNPVTGDHKVIWEINRHQQWLTLGRAYWLTDDQRFRDAFISELTDWIASNPPLVGINWASMLELAFRSLSWTWALEFFAEGGQGTGSEKSAEPPWLVDLLVALDAQLAHIARNLSLYFSPNTHLTGEALALYAVSLATPELRHSGTRAALGRDVLVREAERQVLPDGGHVERSAHYHRYSTDFYLLAFMIARRARDRAAGTFETALRKQAEYLRAIADDRGRLPLIGDDDGGQLFRFGALSADAAPTLNAAAAVLDDPALAVGPPTADSVWIVGGRVETVELPGASDGSRLFADSGYFVHRHRGSQLVFDVGPHGFLNAGHAHADALAIVATIEGDPLLVDPGTATYTMDAAARDRFRSPRMHNTVTLNGEDFARPRGPFHWQHTANARVLRRSKTGGVDLVQATHDGYAACGHVRTVVVVPELGWLIVDHILAGPPTVAEAWWHLHPSWTAAIHDNGATLRHASGRQSALAFAGGSIERVTDPELCAYAPEYGRIERAPVLCVRGHATGHGPLALAAFVPSTYAIGDGLLLRPLLIADEPPPDRLASAWRLDAGGHAVDVFVGARWPHPCIERPRDRVRSQETRRSEVQEEVGS